MTRAHLPRGTTPSVSFTLRLPQQPIRYTALVFADWDPEVNFTAMDFCDHQ